MSKHVSSGGLLLMQTRKPPSKVGRRGGATSACNMADPRDELLASFSVYRYNSER